MSPDGLRGDGAGGEVGVWSVVEDRHPLDPPHHHGMESVRSLEAELTQHGDAHTRPPEDVRCYVPHEYHDRRRRSIRMTQVNRREFLVKSTICTVAMRLVGIAAVPTGLFLPRSVVADDAPATPTVEQWMDAWMKETKVPTGTLHLSRYREPIYFLTKGISWVPSPTQQADFQRVDVPIGFVTDLASIPRIFWSILRPDGAYTYPAIVHDYLYWDADAAKTRRRHDPKTRDGGIRGRNCDAHRYL